MSKALIKEEVPDYSGLEEPGAEEDKKEEPSMRELMQKKLTQTNPEP